MFTQVIIGKWKYGRVSGRKPSKFDKICPSAIPNQISTISMQKPNLVKIHWCLLELSSRNEIWTDIHMTDGWMDGRMDRRMDTIACNIIMSRFSNGHIKMWPLERQQGFHLVLPGDLVSDTKWPSFKLDLEINKTNILSNIYCDYLKNVTSGVLPRFSFDLAWWTSFWPQMTQFQTWLRNHQDKHFGQDSWWLLKKCDL